MQLPCPAPEKPSSLPAEARWNGCCDGGAWIYIKEIKCDTVSIKSFGHDGSYIIDDDDFVLTNCKIDLSLFGKDFIYKNLNNFFNGFINNNDTIKLVRVKKEYSEIPHD